MTVKSLTQKPKLNLLRQFANFTRTTAGLEKTCRLIQSLVHIAIELDITPRSTTTAQWQTARSQIALTRRFFRFFAFIDCFSQVYGLLGAAQGQGLFMTLIEIGRWSCLGLYLVLEDLTILHALGVHPVAWNTPVLVEAFKFWFYSLTLSVLGAVLGLLFTSPSSAGRKTGSNEKKKETKNAEKTVPNTDDSQSKAQRTALMKRIVVDGCDLLIPGVFVGWMQISELVIGVTMVISTVVSGGDAWVKAQG
ncbi:peroxisomal biogenesis factor 11 [Aspergillus pseudotamarii]|uniref:Peroxisomal biogenesis factor 11 n=1 Tax=Aspergillus pseudotamarii TaxID=132259 RepID=A0A5N6SQA1_ASPPS|nr:peroxisomal biogenesis factor 11 [Aspergillus pseudotamarii]KAE8136019.1 peroxisomal biogenesis factor 11 [Aspergillus pseudotamarii]